MSRRRRRPKGRDISGILLLDKSKGGSSNQALQQVKRLFKAQKAGHTGSLDPLASGMLPLCFGRATKISGFLLDADKRYRVKARLGQATATGDAEGEVIEESPVPALNEKRVNKVLTGFIGETQQIPPMYSALKHEGKRLYELAREGVEVERKPRSITLTRLDLVELTDTSLSLDVQCSKGTYVRTLVEDIAKELGTIAHVIELRRTAVGPFDEGMVDIPALEKIAEEGLDALDALLKPVDMAVQHWQRVDLDADSRFYLMRGQPVMVPGAPTEGWVRIYGPNEDFIGAGEVMDDGRIAPRRML